MSTRLSQQTLARIPSEQKPRYKREQITNGIVHLGIGGFHRAHQAVYTDDLLSTGDHRWGIIGVSLRSDSVYRSLAPQGFVYTVKTQDQSGSSRRLIGSVSDVIALPQPGASAKIVAAIANPNTQVVTLTITEKGYCHTIGGELDTANPSIVEDLTDPNQPQSAPGLLALALKHRMETNAGPITLLSCDNLSGNGQVLRNVVSSMVQQLHPTVTDWLEDNVSFPSSMVDRIVPQTKATDIAELERDTGYLDSGLVICEPFSQWIIEDNFAGVKPAWNKVGAEFVANVRPYEQTKLRFLNATHSALAYLGFLAGYDFIHEAMADPLLASFARQLMDIEIGPVVASPDGFDIAAYKDSILTRFANTAVPYRTSQVASDGSQKLPQRILPTIQAQLRLGVATPRLDLVVAAWLQTITGSEAIAGISEINEPLAEALSDIASKHSQPEDMVRAVAQETRCFGDLSQNNDFLTNLAMGITQLRQAGSLATVAKHTKP